MDAILANMRLPVKQRIAAGLLDNEVEIFYQYTEVYAVYQSHCLPFAQWPEYIYDKLDEDMAKHPMAVESLIELGLETRLEMLWQYARCRFGSFDGKPDIDADGHIQHTEYWDCGFRCKCPHEGKICSSMKVARGILTFREIDVIRLIADDLMAKEIADKLHISVTTVPVHTANILRKIAGKRRGDIIKFAISHNMIHNK